MTEIFRLITPITYWILIVLWSFILYFYVKKMWDSKTKQLFQVLVIILAIDAFRTLFESFYFGLWYTSLSGFLPLQVGNFLTRPEFVIIPKIINVVAAIIIIVLLLKRWLPNEEQEQNRLGLALHDSEEEFRAFFENNPLSCWLEDFSKVKNHFENLRKKDISDIESYLDEYPEELKKIARLIKIKDVNQATLDLHKARNKEQLFQGLENTFTQESFEVFRKEIVDLWNGKSQNSYDGVVKTLDGEICYVQVNYRVMPGYENTLEKVLISLVDNTAKWMAEKKLLVSENRLNLAMQFTTDGLYDWNLKTNEIYYSPGWKRMLGYRVDELPDDLSIWEKLTDPEDVQKAWTMQQALINKSIDRFELEFKMLHKEGQWIDILSRAKAIFDENGEAVRIVGTHIDITERKKFEKETNLQKEKLEQYLDLAGVIFVALNSKGEVTLVNQKCCEVLGYTKKEILGNNWFEKFIPERIMNDVIPISRCLLNGEVESTEYVENLILTSKGEERLVAWHNTLVKDTKGNVIGHISAGQDITEKKQLEHDLLQARKMESIGNLAGGVAHDFNNILSSIIGFTELALEAAPQGSTQREDLEEVYIAGNRAKELVQQILAFARQSEKKTKPVRLSDIVTEALKLLRPSTPATIDIKPTINSTAKIMGNGSQLHQIVMNLCTNAIHSLEEKGGTLEIELRNVFVGKESEPIFSELSAGEYAELIVTDNGPGIDSAIIENIFDPYFTTKGIGKGSGMGLAMVKGIVESYGGDIHVKSEPEKKTSFTIRLPVATGKGFEELDQVEPVYSGTERILFVDDEPPIVRMGNRILESLGYKVTVRTSSIEALKLFKERSDQFDLVISDMTMPSMTGDELSIEIRKIKQDIPIIICTGFSNKLNDEKAKHIGINAFAYKPITKSNFAKTVREVLDAC